MLLAGLWARKDGRQKLWQLGRIKVCTGQRALGPGMDQKTSQRGGLGQLVFGGSSCSMRDTRRVLTCGLALKEAAQWPDYCANVQASNGFLRFCPLKATRTARLGV
jgi:hypothetical protein